MGNTVSLTKIVDQLHALPPEKRSKAFDKLCEKHKSYFLSKWKPVRENKPRPLTVKKDVTPRDKLNLKECLKWRDDASLFWSPSYTLISGENNQSPLAFAFDATVKSDSKGHEECARQRYISLFWYDYFVREYGDTAYVEQYKNVARRIENFTESKTDIDGICKTLRHRVKAGRRYGKLAEKFGDGILLTLPSCVSRSTLEKHLPLDDTAFKNWIVPIVGSTWEAQAGQLEVKSAGQLIRQCLMQKTAAKRSRSSDQSGGSLLESHELEPSSKRHKITTHNNNSSNKASKGHGTTNETAVQSRMAVQNLLLDHSSPESSNSVVNISSLHCCSSTNDFHSQIMGANTGSQGTYDTLNIYKQLQDQGQRNIGLGIPEDFTHNLPTSGYEELQDQVQQNNSNTSGAGVVTGADTSLQALARVAELGSMTDDPSIGSSTIIDQMDPITQPNSTSTILHSNSTLHLLHGDQNINETGDVMLYQDQFNPAVEVSETSSNDRDNYDGNVIERCDSRDNPLNADVMDYYDSVDNPLNADLIAYYDSVDNPLNADVIPYYDSVDNPLNADVMGYYDSVENHPNADAETLLGL